MIRVKCTPGRTRRRLLRGSTGPAAEMRSPHLREPNLEPLALARRVAADCSRTGPAPFDPRSGSAAFQGTSRRNPRRTCWMTPAGVQHRPRGARPSTPDANTDLWTWLRLYWSLRRGSHHLRTSHRLGFPEGTKRGHTVGAGHEKKEISSRQRRFRHPDSGVAPWSARWPDACPLSAARLHPTRGAESSFFE